MAPNDFTGQVALVTGGGSGIGRAVCIQLAQEGAFVVITDLNLEAARDTFNLLPDPGNHLALHMDVTQQSDVEMVIAAARDRFGEPPSLLVNSAGIPCKNPFVDVTEDSIDMVINVNLKGTFLVTQAVTRALLEGGHGAGEVRGSIVNISSLTAKVGLSYLSAYSATKGGVLALTKSCATEMARKGIRVNCILPGLIDTPMTRRTHKSWHQIIKMTALGRPGRPEEVAEVVLFLLSMRSSYMVGSCVEINGGLVM